MNRSDPLQISHQANVPDPENVPFMGKSILGKKNMFIFSSPAHDQDKSIDKVKVVTPFSPLTIQKKINILQHKFLSFQANKKDKKNRKPILSKIPILKSQFQVSGKALQEIGKSYPQLYYAFIELNRGLNYQMQQSAKLIKDQKSIDEKLSQQRKNLLNLMEKIKNIEENIAQCKQQQKQRATQWVSKFQC